MQTRGLENEGLLPFGWQVVAPGGAVCLWVVRVGGDDGELRPWHLIYVYSIESRLLMRVRYDSHIIVGTLPVQVLDRLDWFFFFITLKPRVE